VKHAVNVGAARTGLSTEEFLNQALRELFDLKNLG